MHKINKGSKEKLMFKWAIDASRNSSGRLGGREKIIDGKKEAKFVVTAEKKGSPIKFDM